MSLFPVGRATPAPHNAPGTSPVGRATPAPGSLTEALHHYCTQKKIRGKGALAVVLVVTQHARAAIKDGYPLRADDLLTEARGQVLGLGRAAVQSILARYNIVRVLAEEGGRTSRGSIGVMRDYVDFLNTEREKRGTLDVDAAEHFWIGQVEAFFAGKPFTLKLDAAWSVRVAVRHLTKQAVERQQQAGGTMYLGTMMQHLVGAKLQTVLPEAERGQVVHHSANQSDQKADRHGDFDLGDVALHVSTAPSESLVRKCGENLGRGKRPVIITTGKGLLTAEGLLENAGLQDRVDVLEFEQFMAAGVLESGGFSPEARRDAFVRILEAYNAVVDAHETDPSLRIEMSDGK